MNVRTVDKNTTRRIYVHLKTSATANLTGVTPTLTIIRESDGFFWTGSAWQAGAATVNMSELDATNAAGVYYYAFAVPDSHEQYLLYIDGTASATYIRYHSEYWIADITANAVAGNYTEQDINGANKLQLRVYDHDATTQIGQLDPTVVSGTPTVRKLTPS